MANEYTTLRELDVKPGDVVEHRNGFEAVVADNHTDEFCRMKNGGAWTWGAALWRIVSRASDTPKLWRDMTAEEKGALLLAHHEGEVIEQYELGHWGVSFPVEWLDSAAYRIRPEPKRETVTLYGQQVANPHYNPYQSRHDTHRITFDLIDGKPDCDSIKMEEL